MDEFKAGDSVRVGPRPADVKDWPVWADAMDATVGKVGEVTHCGATRPHVVVTFLDGRTWAYKPSWVTRLAEVELKEPTPDPLKAGDRVWISPRPAEQGGGPLWLEEMDEHAGKTASVTRPGAWAARLRIDGQAADSPYLWDPRWLTKLDTRPAGVTAGLKELKPARLTERVAAVEQAVAGVDAAKVQSLAGQVADLRRRLEELEGRI
jgi:hypothetical protein